MTWLPASLVILALALAAGFAWYERRHPSARVLALVGALAALAVVGRIAFAALPNVKPTTDIVLFSGFALGGAPGFAVGALAALVSNLFFGQGPWTPWQMAAWGGVGLFGAALARVSRGRELGRVPLAIACGFAGLFFGVVMDAFQWTLTEPHTVASYATISATSLTFNLAHAIGNVVFCLLIGPAFVRALRRYQRRFEFRWAAPATAAAAVALVLMAALPPGTASAATPTARAIDFLRSAQNSDGGFGAARGQGSTQLHSGWVSLGLAAANRNPRAFQRGGKSAIDYMSGGAGSLNDTGEIERTILVLRASGLSARDFAGRDLIAELQRRRKADGSYGTVNWTAFAVMALRASGVGGTGKSVSYLVKQQNSDGGFGFSTAASSDADDTGSVLQALAAGGKRGSSATRRALAYLKQSQHADGGWGQMPSQPSNAQSTAWAVQGIVAAGRNPSSFGADPLAYLRGLQRSDGSFRYSRSSAQTPVWVTAQALVALQRKAFPLAAVAMPARRSPSSAPSASTRRARKKKQAKKTGVGGSAGAEVASPSATPPATAPPASASGKPASARVPARPRNSDATTAWVIVGASAAALLAIAALWWRRRREMDDVLPRI
ncbi:MAG: energy-coupling factor transport system substrate-specific component [Thermoleophilales bacterium]|nr:energy-coupling factor transport system substrate-specific component [Thermoleophilales bacterium]